MKRKTPSEHVARAETNQRHEVAHMMENFETELQKRKELQNMKAESQAEECGLCERAASIQTLSGIPKVDLQRDAEIKNISMEDANICWQGSRTRRKTMKHPLCSPAVCRL